MLWTCLTLHQFCTDCMTFNPALWPHAQCHKVDSYDFSFVKQDVSVSEQEKIDKLMLDMDGTDNKCKPTLQMYV